MSSYDRFIERWIKHIERYPVNSYITIYCYDKGFTEEVQRITIRIGLHGYSLRYGSGLFGFYKRTRLEAMLWHLSYWLYDRPTSVALFVPVSTVHDDIPF